MDKSTTWMQSHRQHLLIGGPVLLITAVLLFYLLTMGRISTDDAYVRAGLVSISSNVPGKVAMLAVHDNQAVKRGDILFRLDQRPYQLAVAHANAELANAYLAVQALKTVYQEKTAEVQAAQGTLAYEQEQLTRQTKMAKSGLSSQMELNKVTNTFNNAKQQLIVVQQQQANILAQLNNDADITANHLPVVQIAVASLHQALLNLSYATIKAPCDGIVAKVDNLQMGDYVQIGAPVFALVSLQNIWLEANFKETQITHMKPGQDVSIKIDAYPNEKWTGHVLSQSPGTGSIFSLLPAENATGNWVKVVQRVPIRISIDNPSNKNLAAGLSAVVTVDTSSTHE